MEHDALVWHAHWKVEKFRGDADTPYEVVEGDGNMLVYGGGSALWDLLIGGGTVTAFNNANAYLGVGDSSTAAAATQTDLQASTNKFREPMDATYPQHTDGTGAASNALIVYKSTFETGDANFDWNEWGLFNASTAGRMLNRKVYSFGTKTSSDTWALTVTLSFVTG